MRGMTRVKPRGRTAKAWRSAKVASQEHAGLTPRRKMRGTAAKPFVPAEKS